jgi:hypothetical protein
VSGTFLLVGLNRVTDEVLGAELDGHGAPIQVTESTISTSAPPARYTRVISSTTSKTWNANWSGRSFNAMTDQIVQTATSDAAPLTNPRMSVDTPVTNTTVDRDLFVAGWAIDQGAPAGTGIDAIHIWAFPRSGAPPRFLGVAGYGIARPDVASVFGNSRFVGSGFELSSAIDVPGTYDVAVYGHSTVTQQFSIVSVFTLNVSGSLPVMWVDTPTPGSAVKGSDITISGWAIDLRSSSSAGVDTINVWAFPVAGGDPLWVGAAAVDIRRDDVAAAFGSAAFAVSGYTARGTLPAGDYDLVVFARSTVHGGFNNLKVVRIHAN